MYILLALQSFNSHLSLVSQHQQPNGWNNFYHAAHYRPLPSTVTSRAANCPYIAPKSKGMKEYPRWSWILNNYVKTWKNTVSPSVEPNSNQIASLLEAINCPSDLFLFPLHLLLLIVVLQAHGKKRRKQCGSSGRFQPNYIYIVMCILRAKAASCRNKLMASQLCWSNWQHALYKLYLFAWAKLASQILFVSDLCQAAWQCKIMLLWWICHGYPGLIHGEVSQEPRATTNGAADTVGDHGNSGPTHRQWNGPSIQQGTLSQEGHNLHKMHCEACSNTVLWDLMSHEINVKCISIISVGMTWCFTWRFCTYRLCLVV